MAYVKLDDQLLDSTVWQEGPTVKLVWITLLLLCKPNGIVSIPIPGLARRAGVSLKECIDALEVLEAPDIHSRTKTNEGRRIEEVKGDEVCWKILNYTAYRNKDHTAAERQKRYRDRQKAKLRELETVTRNITQAEAEAEAEAKESPLRSDSKKAAAAAKKAAAAAAEADAKKIQDAATPTRNQIADILGIQTRLPVTEHGKFIDWYLDDRIAGGWTNRHGKPIADWTADVRSAARRWCENLPVEEAPKPKSKPPTGWQQAAKDLGIPGDLWTDLPVTERQAVQKHMAQG